MYRSRRLRKPRVTHPEYVLTVPDHLTQEQADQVMQAWKNAGRAGVLVVNDQIRVERLR